MRAFDALFLVPRFLSFAGTLVPPLEFLVEVQRSADFLSGQCSYHAASLLGRAVQLFAVFRGNRLAGGARWADVTSPL